MVKLINNCLEKDKYKINLGMNLLHNYIGIIHIFQGIMLNENNSFMFSLSFGFIR